MDKELASWLAALVPLDETDSAMLRVLACESPRSTSSSGGSDLDALEQRLLSVDVSHAQVPIGSDHGRPPEKKRKKHSTWRAKNEIERLRQTVVDLETLIALRSRQRAGGRHVSTTDSGGLSSEDMSIWKDVAARQFKRLRDSRRENQELHVQVQQQHAIAKNLARLIQRAQAVLQFQSQQIYRNPTPVDEAMLAYKRQELLAIVHCGFPSLEYVVRDSLLQLPGAEGRATQKIADPRSDSIQSGTVLVHAQARRFVPSRLEALGQQLWSYSQEAAIGKSKFEPLCIERSDEHYLVAHTMEFETPHGPALFRSIGAATRIRVGSRDVTVSAGSFWPDASAPANVQGSGFDMKSWTVAQPSEASPGTTEVLFHTQCSFITTPNRSSSLTPPQAMMLGELVTHAQKYVLDGNDQLVDKLLLEASGQQL